MPPRKREETLVNPSHPPVPTEAPRTANEANFASDEKVTAKNLSEQDKVRIRLYQVPKDSTDKPMPDEFVSVNGHNYIIKRGETVEVPQTVFEVLEHAGRL